MASCLALRFDIIRLSRVATTTTRRYVKCFFVYLPSTACRCRIVLSENSNATMRASMLSLPTPCPRWRHHLDDALSRCGMRLCRFLHARSVTKSWHLTNWLHCPLLFVFL